MRWICLRSLAFLAAASLFLAAGIALAQQSGLLPESPGESRMSDPAGGKTSASATLEEPPGSVPTPAKHRPAPPVNVTAVPAKAKPGENQLKMRPADESLNPVADLQEGPPPPLVAASFKGVVPGTSTKADVAGAWGPPKKTTRVNGSLVELYSVEPFKRVEVNYADGKVSSIVIRLDKSFPVNAVAKQLDLTAVRPVLVVNELGEVLGRAYPERGVLLEFLPSDKPGKASLKVSQIILEPLSAESFVLRAETTMDSRHDLSRRDLEQALTLEPGNARAHWLYGRVLASTEQYEKAVKEAGEAVRLDPHDAQYRVTHAQTFAQAGQLPEALEEARKAIAISEDRPHVRARATCMVADLLASGPKPDFKKALTFHTQALQLADPLCNDPHPAIRLAAKEVQIDAYLGTAHDIAWGEWKDKPKAVVRWLERAKAVADDVVANEGSSQEQLFRVHARALAAFVGLHDAIDPAPAAKGLTETGEKLIAAARDPGRKARLHWELGMALYDAVQICQMRRAGQRLEVWRSRHRTLGPRGQSKTIEHLDVLARTLVLPAGRDSRDEQARPPSRRRLVRQGSSPLGTRDSRRPRRRYWPTGRGFRRHGRFLLGDRPARPCHRLDDQGGCVDGAGRQAGDARALRAGRSLQQPGLDAAKAGQPGPGQAFPGDGQPHQEREHEVNRFFGETAMRRYLSWTFLVAAGLLLGVLSSSYQRSNADPPAAAAANADSANCDAVAELKEINAQLKELNAQLKKGTTRVFVMMNPPQ